MYSGQFTDFKIYSTPFLNMREMTQADSEKCGAGGDFINWKEANWTLSSMARLIEADSARGACRKEPEVDVYPMREKHHHSYCMQHCEKLGGRSPPVRTSKEWNELRQDLQQMRVDPLKLPKALWLSATEGDKNSDLNRLDHWPEGMNAIEGVWRDYFTGEELENYTKPWLDSRQDHVKGDTHNCISYYHTNLENFSWQEWQCLRSDRGCPCTYKTPILQLRGGRYTPMQLQADPTDVFFIGQISAAIKYNSSKSQWILEDPMLQQ